MRINTLNPLNRQWGPNNGLVMRLLTLPHNSGGRQWFDVAGANHGTLTNGPTWPSMRRDNSFGCVNFDGTNDYVNLGSPASLNLTGVMTFACWFKANGNYTTAQALIGCSNASGNQGNYIATFGYTDNKFEFWNEDNAGPLITATRSISDDLWHHYVVTRSGSSGSWNLSLYIDGVLDKAGTTANNPFGGTHPVSIGRFGGYGGYYLNGSGDDFSLWNRAISATEIQAIYNDSRTGYSKSLNWIKPRVATPPAAAASGGPFPFFTSRRMRGGLIGMNGGL